MGLVRDLSSYLCAHCCIEFLLVDCSLFGKRTRRVMYQDMDTRPV
jgi:hypothetical protein